MAARPCDLPLGWSTDYSQQKLKHHALTDLISISVLSNYRISMLILTRRPQETIRVGEDVTITILAVEGNKVRVGIAAPRNIVVDRQEVYERKQRETGDEDPLPGDADQSA
jgi:carbon storage regulator